MKPWKKFFPTYSVLEKSVYHLIVAISVELPRFISRLTLPKLPIILKNCSTKSC